MGLFRRSKRRKGEDDVKLEDARREAREARKQLEQARARRPKVEAEIQYQRKARAENGFAEILEGIFSTKG